MSNSINDKMEVKRENRWKGCWENGSMGSIRYFPPGSSTFMDYTIKILMRHDRIATVKGNSTSRSVSNFSDIFEDILKPTAEEITLFEMDYGTAPPPLEMIIDAQEWIEINSRIMEAEDESDS